MHSVICIFWATYANGMKSSWHDLRHTVVSKLKTSFFYLSFYILVALAVRYIFLHNTIETMDLIEQDFS